MGIFGSNKGFTLVEVMIAAGLMGALSLALMKFSGDQMKAQKTVESNYEVSAVLGDMRSLLTAEQSCLATFGGLNINTAEGVVTSLKKQEFYLPPAPATPIANRFASNTNSALGTFIGNGNVKVLGYQLSAAADSKDPAIGVWSALPAPSLNRTGSLNLFVRFYVGKVRTISNAIKTKTIKLNAEISPANTIVSCSGSSGTGGLGIDGRYLHRESSDDNYRTMRGDLIIADPFEIVLASDERLKYDVKAMSEILPKLKKLKPVTFKWKSNHKTVNGLLAQDVQKVFPELVTESNNILAVNYIQLTPLLLNGIQEVEKENSQLKNKIIELEFKQQLLINELCNQNVELTFCRR